MTNYFVHESAYVDEGAQIGEGTKIWHFCHIMKGTTLGKNCKIGQNVVIGPNVAVGDGCKIQNNIMLPEGVILEDFVFCGPAAVFTNIKVPRSEVPRNTSEHYLPTLVKRGVSIGANAVIICGVTLHEYAFVAAGAVVTKDVPAYAMVAGTPARFIHWVSAYGEVLRFDTEGYATDSTGAAYRRVAAMEVRRL